MIQIYIKKILPQLSRRDTRWVFHYTRRAPQMSFPEVVNSWMVCPYCPIFSLLRVLEIRWRLRITDAKPSSNFGTKCAIKSRC